MLVIATGHAQRDAMALAARLRSAVNGNSDPDPVVSLPRLADDPEVIRLNERKAVLRRAYAAREALLQIRSIDNDLRGVASSSKGPRADILRERRVTLLATLPQPTEAQSVPGDEVGLHPDVLVGLRVMRGQKLPEASDSTGETTRLQREMNALAAAIRQTDGELDQLREDRSMAVARELLDQHRAVLRSKFQAAMALCQAAATERQLVVAMINAGYTTQPGILMSPRLDAADALGSTARADSPICRYRDALEMAGVL
jgi:hypothetical protein